MPKNLLYAHILLDRSGSMMPVQDRTIDAVNEYLSGLTADKDTDAAVSITLFDAPGGGLTRELSEIVNGAPVATATRLSRANYVPRGGTPLNDAIGLTVEKMRGQYHRPDERIALVIVTDGHENASREYSTAAVKALLDSVQKDGWLVLYLGANQDAFAEGQTRGIGAGTSLNFASSNVKGAMGAALRSTKSYAASGQSVDAMFSDAERADAK